MKRRYRLLLNLFSLSLLCVALYLNFFRKEKPEIAIYPTQTISVATAAVKQTQSNTITETAVHTAALK